MDLLQPHSGQEAATIDISKEAAACANWPTRERLRALKRIIPRAAIEGVLQRTGTNRAHCRRLPAWFLVGFVIALGLFCRDCYRQVFRWLQPYRNGGTPRRTTLCEARKRLGVAPMRLLTEQVIRLQGTPTTPGAFYRGMRTMALDGFVVDVPETPANERAFGSPRQQPRPRRVSPGPRAVPVRDRQPRPLAVPDQAVLPRRGHDGPPPAAVVAEGHAAAVGPELPQLPDRRRGAPARGAST